MAEGFDYVIVGGGTAGCVLAARLTENPAIRVCLLEAGGRDTHPLIHVPVGFAKMTTGPLTWASRTAPQKHANNREIPYVRRPAFWAGAARSTPRSSPAATPPTMTAVVEEGAAGWALPTSASISSAPKATASCRANGTHRGAAGRPRTRPTRSR